ncbi:MAG: CheR family methyltransferase [Exilispira sp.]
MKANIITDELFEKFSYLLYNKAGIKLPVHKKYLLEYRLSKYIGEETGYQNFQELYKALISDKDVMNVFIEEMTTNYTYFFREYIHFNFLYYYLLNYGILQPYVNIWSAACSSGEEPYSIAMVIYQTQNFDLINKSRILATDISEKVLIKAISGMFSRRSVEENSEINILKSKYSKFFKYDRSRQLYLIDDNIKNLIYFRKLNLVDPYPFTKYFDIVFLRNVLIYFDNNVKEEILNKIYKYIKPKGYLIISLSESLVGIKHKFIQKKYSIYQKF